MRKEDLKQILDDLTLEEKVGQLVQLSGEFFQGQELSIGPLSKLGIDDEQIKNVGSVLNVSGATMTHEIQKRYMENSRHKIPLLFMGDIVYGFKTVLPSPMGIGSTWNRELVETSYKMVAQEGSAAGVHVTFSPMVDLVRDPRWGRVLESTGEDVYLNSEYAKSMVKGFQNDFKPGSSMAACVKHFAGYGAGEGGRDYNTVDMSRWRLENEQLPAYKAAIDAGAKLVMTSFNTIEGVPATGNKWLMNDLLRGKWGFEGVVISDYAAVYELIAHGVAKDEREATKLALEASVDIDMKTPCYINHAKGLVESGSIELETLDKAVMRVLELKNDLGLFEDPYRGASATRETQQTLTQHTLDVAKNMSDESIVLLKNNGILPLDTKTHIGLVGPFADAREVTGMWAINADYASIVTLKSAMSECFTNLKYGKGIEIVEDMSIYGAMGMMIQQKIESITGKPKPELDKIAAETAIDFGDVVVLTLGEHIMGSGEGGSRSQLDIEPHQMKLARDIKARGKKLVTVVYSGRPLIIQELTELSDALIWAWYPGTMGGQSLSDILCGRVNPSGRLSMSFPINVGQIPVYYNHFSTGRPLVGSNHSERFVSKYTDVSNDPLFAFGEGLSYHKTQVTNLRLDKQSMKEDDTVSVSVDVHNESDLKGLESIQVYVRDCIGSVVRPVKQLVDFKKIELDPHASKTISFTLDRNAFSFINPQSESVCEAGEFEIFVGLNSSVQDAIKFEIII